MYSKNLQVLQWGEWIKMQFSHISVVLLHYSLNMFVFYMLMFLSVFSFALHLSDIVCAALLQTRIQIQR